MLPHPGYEARALGAYLGLAIGDALGATVEFMTPAAIAREHGVHRELIGGGWLHLAPGEVTDDTQMSLALGDALIAGQGFELQRVADAFVAWLRGRPKDCGNTCRRGIRRYLLDGSLQGPPNEGDAGNGAVMRNLPVVLSHLDDDAGLVAATLSQCRFTHHHPHSDAAAVCLARMTSRLIVSADLRAAQAEADALVAAHPVFAHADYRGRATAYVVDTVRTVLSIFFASDGFEQTLIATVNRGDDADTTGALVGMLAGARYGVDAIPERWLRALDRETRVHIEAQVQALLTIAAGAPMS